MANPLKVLTALSASSGVAVSNGFNVASGDATIQGVRITTVNDVTGAISNLSSRSEVTSAINTAVANFPLRSEVTSAIANFPLRSEVTSAVANFPLRSEVTGGFVAKNGSGDVTIAGNLTVNGTTTTVNSQNLLVQDPVLLIGSGSSGHADGDRGFIFDLAAGNKAFYWDQSDSKFTLAATTTDGTTNTIVPGALQPLSVGQLYFSASAQDAVGGQIYESGSNSVETTLFNLVDVISGMMGSALTANQVQTAYKGVRFNSYASFLINNRAIIVLSEETSIGQNNLSNGNFNGDRTCTGSAILGMSGSSAADLSTKLAQLSFDVTTRASGSLTWTNDLLSVQVTPVQSGSYWYPQFTIDAPGLGDGQGGHLVRLVAVNDKGDDFVIV
jgi:hypothetical protein